MRAAMSGLILFLFLISQNVMAGVPEEWTTPIDPVLIADHLYYVGSEDLASYLIVTPGGNILINANLKSSPALIRASVEKLGFKWTDIKILLNSQAHSDHMGGAAQVINETHALNMVMEGDDQVVESGGRTDFLAPSDNIPQYPPAHVDRVLHDDDKVQLGGFTLVAHKTAGHTRGCTTWTLRAHMPGDPANQLRDIVIVGGVGFWSEYHFAESKEHHESYPGIAQDFQRTFSTLRSLHADVFLGAHGGYFDLTEKLQRYPALGPKVFIDPTGYQSFIDEAEQKFKDTLRGQ